MIGLVRLPLRYLCGSFLARFAEEGMGVTMALLALQRTGSVGQAAALSAAWLAPHILAAPFIGSLAARSRRPGRFYALCLGGVATAMGAATALLGLAPLWLVCAIAVAGGACGPAVSGGLSSLVAELLPERYRDHGYGWDSATYNAASIAGVGAATAIAALWSAEFAGVMLTVSALVAAVLVGLLPRGSAASGESLSVAEPSRPASAASTATGLVAGTDAAAGPTARSPIAGADPAIAPKTTSLLAATGPAAEPTATKPIARTDPAATPTATSSIAATGLVVESTATKPVATPTATSRGAATGSAAVPSPADAAESVGAFAEPVAADSPIGPPVSPSLREDLTIGLKALWHNKVLRIVTAATCLAYLGIGGLTITTVLTARQWGGSDSGGALLTAFSVGALAGALALTRWTPPVPPQRLAGYCLAVTGIALGLAAFSTDLWLGVALFAVAGAGDGPLLSATLRVRAAHAPRRARAQVFTTGAALKLSAAALGAGLAGAFESLPPALPLALIAGTQLAASLLVWRLAPAAAKAAAASPAA